MNKLYVFIMMFATLALAVPAFAGQASATAPVPAEFQPTKKELKAQKKALRKAVRKATVKSMFKKDKAEKKPAAEAINVILAIFIPPLGVYLHQGKTITTDFWICLALTIITAWTLGAVYALLVVLDVFSVA